MYLCQFLKRYIDGNVTWKFLIQPVCLNRYFFKSISNTYVLWNTDKMLHVPVIMDTFHDDVIKWKHFPRYWPFVRGIHRSPVNSPHKGQWRGALMFSLICVWINGWVNNREAGDLRRYRAHYDVNVMRAFTMILHERHGFENHQQPDCLFNRLFSLYEKSNPRVTGPLYGESVGDWWVPFTKMPVKQPE